MKDFIGRPIKVGDLVAHATRHSSALGLTRKRVTGLSHGYVFLQWTDAAGDHKSIIKRYPHALDGEHPYLAILREDA